MLNTLLDEISREEKVLIEKRAVVKFLRERIAREEAEAVQKVSADAVQKSSPNSSQRAQPLPDRQSPATLLEHVTTAIKKMEGSEFSAAEIHRAVLEQGASIKSATPRASVSTALGRLVERGVITLVAQGGGNAPNRYRRVHQAEWPK